jgi:hypothetical protein
MLLRFTLLACLLAFTGCAPGPRVDAAQMPPQSGLSDPANAISYAAWAFASPARTRNDPVSAARAVATLDYLGGELINNHAWVAFSPIIADQMVDARTAMRRTLGIATTAPSQFVVNSMLNASAALAHGDRQAALTFLSGPVYTLGPDQTLALLTNMPFIHVANVATIEAEGAANGTFCALGCAPGGRLPIAGLAGAVRWRARAGSSAWRGRRPPAPERLQR